MHSQSRGLVLHECFSKLHECCPEKSKKQQLQTLSNISFFFMNVLLFFFFFVFFFVFLRCIIGCIFFFFEICWRVFFLLIHNTVYRFYFSKVTIIFDFYYIYSIKTYQKHEKTKKQKKHTNEKNKKHAKNMKIACWTAWNFEGKCMWAFLQHCVQELVNYERQTLYLMILNYLFIKISIF